MKRSYPLHVVLCGLLALAAPCAVRAEAIPLPAGFMALDRVKAQSGIQIEQRVSPTILRADGAPIPTGFMPLDRGNIRPLNPSRNPAVLGSYHMINKKTESTVAAKSEPAATVDLGDDDASDEDTDEPDTAAVPEAASIPTFRDVVKRIGSHLRHAWPLPTSAEQHFSSAFGMRADPFTHQPRFHEGIDIAAPKGTPVLASADGVVETVARGQQFGKYITVKHQDGSTSTYGHLSQQFAHEGQRVQQGQKLGEVGSTGRSTAAHLHFQINEQGEAVNPLALLTPPWRSGIGVAMRDISQ